MKISNQDSKSNQRSQSVREKISCRPSKERDCIPYTDITDMDVYEYDLSIQKRKKHIIHTNISNMGVLTI